MVLRPAPGESIGAGLGIPQVVNIPLDAPVGKDVEEATELPVKPTQGRYHTRQKGGSAWPVVVRVKFILVSSGFAQYLART